MEDSKIACTDRVFTVADDDDEIAKRDRAIHTIGNLTLVNGRLNPALSNAPWENKVETLAVFAYAKSPSRIWRSA